MAVAEIADERRDFRGESPAPEMISTKMQVARRIEKVDPEEVFAKLGRIAFRDLSERNTAGVAGEDGARGAMGNCSIVERALDGQIFGNGLDDPVAVGDLCEIVAEAPGRNQSGGFGDKECRRSALESSLDAIARRLVGNIEEYRRNPGIGKMRGDAGTTWFRLPARRHGELVSALA